MKVYTLNEASELMKLSTQTLRHYCMTGKLEAVKIGRQWRISEGALESFLRGNHKPTMWHKNRGLTDDDIEPVEVEELLATTDPENTAQK